MALPPPSPSTTALITGASSGIGAEIARRLAERGHGVTLVARRRERLEELAAELSQAHEVRAEVEACDLTSPEARRALIEAVEHRSLGVAVLVNNAGFGNGGLFHEQDAETELDMVRTNVEALLHLCHAFVPGMVRRGAGAVLNVASVAAFQPVPRQATYGATKAFVLSLTDAMSADLHGTGVTATSLCPGPVPTEFGEVAGVDEGLMNIPGVSVSPADVASAAVDGLERGKRVVVPGAATRAAALLGSASPRWMTLEALRRFYPVK
jgi:hypothetical protein